jgi:hypothetical protein
MAVLSLSTSFIALPKKELLEFIKLLNIYGNTDCSLVDGNYYAVYCKKMSL